MPNDEQSQRYRQKRNNKKKPQINNKSESELYSQFILKESSEEEKKIKTSGKTETEKNIHCSHK